MSRIASPFPCEVLSCKPRRWWRYSSALLVSSLPLLNQLDTQSGGHWLAREMAFIDLIRSMRCQVLNDIVEHPGRPWTGEEARACVEPVLCKWEWMLLAGWAEDTPLLLIPSHWDVICEVCHVNAFIFKCNTMDGGQAREPYGVK